MSGRRIIRTVLLFVGFTMVFVGFRLEFPERFEPAWWLYIVGLAVIVWTITDEKEDNRG